MKFSMRLLLFSEFLFILGAGLFGPIYAIFVEKIGGDILEAGMAWGIFLLSMALIEYPIGLIIDRYSKKKFLIFCYLLGATSVFGYIFVQNIYELFFLQLLMGVAIAFGDPAWEAWYSNLSAITKRGHDWAMYHLVIGSGQGLAAIGGGILAHYMGFWVLFIIGGVAGMIGAVVTLFAKEPKIKVRRIITHYHKFGRKKIKYKK